MGSPNWGPFLLLVAGFRFEWVRVSVFVDDPQVAVWVLDQKCAERAGELAAVVGFISEVAVLVGAVEAFAVVDFFAYAG